MNNNNTGKRKNFWGRTFRILLSLLCSLLLWVYVTGTEGNNYSQTFTGVSVVYDGETALRESRGLVITDRYESTIRATVTGSRRIVSRLRAADLTAVVSLSDIYTTGYKDKTYSIVFPGDVDASSLTTSRLSPTVVSFEVDQLSSKTIPVEGVFKGSAAEGFSAQTLSFNPNTVTISGPLNSLEAVDHAWIDVTRTDVDKTLVYESSYVLMDAEGNIIEDENISMDTATVEVTLPITAIREVALTVKLIEGGGATEKDVKVSVTPESIVLSGDADTLAGANNIDVASIDLSELTENTLTQTYRIVIPNDTEIISGVQEATVTLEVVGLDTMQVQVSNLSTINVPENVSAAILSDSLQVTIRGRQEVLDTVSDNNVRAVADMANYSEARGIQSVPVRIYVDGTTEAGAVGKYNIYVRVSDPTESEQAEDTDIIDNEADGTGGVSDGGSGNGTAE